MIQVRNLYALLAFSMRDLNLVSDQEVGSCDFDKPHEVLAVLLERAVHRAFRRGIDRQYRSIEDSGARLCGSLNTGRTVRGLLQIHGKLAFDADELLRDTDTNRVLKAALGRIQARPELRPELRRKLTRYQSELQSVASLRATTELAGTAARARAPRGNAAYGMALMLSRLVLAENLVDQGRDGSQLRGLLCEEQRLPMLYEGFMRGLSQYLLGTAYRVRSKEPAWPIRDSGPAAASWMPTMRTDVHIERKASESTVHNVGIIECKFYEAPFASSQHSLQDKWRSAHLYQQLAYLQAEAATEPGRSRSSIRGTIAYAHHEAEFDETFELHGFPFRMVTVNLNLPWLELRARVEDVVRWSMASESTPEVATVSA